MKKLHLFYFVLLLGGIVACQEDVQKKETLSEFEEIEKSLPASIQSDTSFLAFKEAYLFTRDYTGTKPDSIGYENVLYCLQQHLIADTAFLEGNTRPEFVAYLLDFNKSIPEILTNCGLGDNEFEYYMQASFEFNARYVDLIDRYEDLRDEKNPISALFEKFNLPQMTPNYWINR